MTPDSQLKYVKLGRTAFDAELLRVAEQNVRPGMVVWDIGANIGVFALAATHLAQSHTIAIEPDIWLASMLKQTAELDENTDLGITVLHAAIADRNGIAKLLISAKGRASNSLELPGAEHRMGGVRGSEIVATLTLDTLLDSFEAPDFVKIDVEGAEWAALQGARRLLNEVKPKIYIEVFETNCDRVTATLVDAGYALYDCASEGGGVRVKRCVYNTLAVPDGKATRP